MPRVLAVDDDGDVLEIIEEIFCDNGWDITGAGSAARARERLARTRFDMVVVDCMMPGEPGLSLAQHAHSLGLPVLIITGDAARLPDLEPGGFAVLAKPFRIAELMQAADAVLHSTDPTRAA